MRRMLIAGLIAGVLAGCVIVPGRPPGHGGIPPGRAETMGPPLLLVAPRLILIPDTNIYVATGIAYDVFVVGGAYYFWYEGVWYSGPSHQGPWRTVDVRDLPPGLQKSSPGQLQQQVPPRLREG